MAQPETDPPPAPDALHAAARLCWVCAAAIAPGPRSVPVFIDDYGGVHATAGAMGMRRIAYLCPDCAVRHPLPVTDLWAGPWG